ncbi:hypothetical protein KFZ56_17660 [Virgibacillus sp. NKC19-3]|uniref:hypothetical protein n=1 Tax=Virgibacillus saliphilus TaxID=2831674 RepID=UPI001C9B2337|nr:hypothetical protein [Virgibacillus sp. NKC19-3]MBY7144849.1 hypothetical protein [Virgibacillus sp. NKC19-3]
MLNRNSLLDVAKEFFFPDINAFLSIVIGALAALVGYLIQVSYLRKMKESKKLMSFDS